VRAASAGTSTSGPVERDLAVEAPGPQQCRIQDFRTVGGGQQDHTLVGVKAIHLHQQLVQGLLLFVVPSFQPADPTCAPQRVQFVDKDDAWRLCHRLGEQVAHARGPDPDEHFHKLRTADGKEGHARLARDGLGQQGLAGAGRADDQDPLRDPAAQLAIAVRVAQEFDKLHQLFLRLVDPCHVGEADAGLVRLVHPCMALADAEQAIAQAAAGAAGKAGQDKQQQERQGPPHQRAEPLVFLQPGIAHVRTGQLGHQLGVGHAHCLEPAFGPRAAYETGSGALLLHFGDAVGLRGTRYRLLRQDQVLDPAQLEQLLELAIGQFLAARAGPYRQQQQRQQRCQQPEPALRGDAFRLGCRFSHCPPASSGCGAAVAGVMAHHAAPTHAPPP
jgi:hypothetical protein